MIFWQVGDLESEIDYFEAEMENLQVKKGKARPPRLVELLCDGLDLPLGSCCSGVDVLVLFFGLGLTRAHARKY